MRRRAVNLVHAIGIVTIAVTGVLYTLIAGNTPLLGLDLQGGASVVLQPTRSASQEELDISVEIIRNRVDALGVAEPEISTQGGNILVQLPGVEDQQRAIDLVGQTAELRFRPVIEELPEMLYQRDRETKDLDRFFLTDTSTDAITADSEAVLADYGDDRSVLIRYIVGPSSLTGDALESAQALYSLVDGWHVLLTFKRGPVGIDGFNELSSICYHREASCPSKKLAIEIDDEIISAPLIQNNSSSFIPFERSQTRITGDFSEEEAKDLALVLNYGVLPIELEAQQSRIVSASIGTDALRAGVIAGIIGLVLVSLYLLVYYRLMGFVAIASLVLSGAMLWTIIAWLGEHQGLALTLAGVTGLIVAIGVSVDSNVVYFEHLKEDIRSGRSVRSSAGRAFTTAFSTIVKADVASLIAAVVLYVLTVGQVRGFAFYLGLATVLDLVASYFFMGPLISLIAHNQKLRRHLSWFGVAVPVGQATK
ncbi:MAG: protein translocase subunit SecD [Acidimicrobiaceae bacterium]|nr:protein translocase subunit SecD [Acidimicrobiaceae bacterium]